MLRLENTTLQRNYKIGMIMREEKNKKKEEILDAQRNYNYNITNTIKNILIKGI
jgi:hypothetical protein